MNLPFFIARRYFYSRKKKNFINIISIISMLAVGFGTMALVVALSVFNGLEELLRSLYSSFDPELKISLVQGKSFPIDNSFLAKIKSVEGVEVITEVIEDNVYVRYRDSEMIATLKGVTDNYIKQGRIEDHLVFGEIDLKKEGMDYALLGRGVQYILSISPSNDFYALQMHYPRNVKPGPSLPSKLTKQMNILPGGVFAVEKGYDEKYIIVPLDFAAKLLDYGNKRTNLEVKIAEGYSLDRIQSKLASLIGPDFQVLNRDEQHSDILKIIRIEKLFVFLIFSFIIVIASFNIFFALTMLAIEKRKDVAILYSLGANHRLIQSIFITEGGIIAFVGAFTGLLLGYLVCWGQETFGLVSMGMETAVLEAYPVKVKLADFLFTALAIMAITMLASYRPARRATQTNLKEHLY